MGLLILVLTADALFMGCLLTGYFVVTRRRAKIYVLVEHLASLARIGLPLQAGLRALGADLGGLLGTRLARVARKVEEGASLSAAFESMPALFPPLLRSMVGLGERSGNLAVFLEEMRGSYRRMVERPFQNLYAFLYPVLLSICLTISLAFLYLMMVPKLEEMMAQMRFPTDVYSPWWPRVMVAQQVVLASCILVALAGLLGGFTPHFGFPLFRAVRRVLDRMALRIPFLGPVLRDAAAQQFALCAGQFLRAGALLPEALAAAAQSQRNEAFRAGLARVAALVGEGTSLSGALRRERLFPDDLLWFVETGEAAGSLPAHLLQAAAHYDTKVRFSARIASRLVIPLFVLLNGLLVLSASLLIYLPIFAIERASIPP